MSQSLSSNVPDNSPEQEAATGHPIPRRLDSPTSQAIQLPELELTLTPATEREHSQEINNHSVPTLISQAPGPSRKRSRSPSSPFFLDANTFSDASDLRNWDLCSCRELDRIYCKIRVVDAEDRLAEDHEQIQIILGRLKAISKTCETAITIFEEEDEKREHRAVGDKLKMEEMSKVNLERYRKKRGGDLYGRS
ncbi:hypothetical protein Tco_0536265 [Tanacetum coccineum]